MLWTVFTTREYSPDEIAAFDGEGSASPRIRPRRATIGAGLPWLVGGAALGALVFALELEKESICWPGCSPPMASPGPYYRGDQGEASSAISWAISRACRR